MLKTNDFYHRKFKKKKPSFFNKKIFDFNSKKPGSLGLKLQKKRKKLKIACETIKCDFQKGFDPVVRLLS